MEEKAWLNKFHAVMHLETVQEFGDDSKDMAVAKISVSKVSTQTSPTHGQQTVKYLVLSCS